MSFRKTIAAVVLLAVVVGVYFLYEKPRMKRAAEEKESKDKILSVAWDDVDQITIAAGSVSIVMKKGEADQWKVVTPFEDDADKYAVQGVISAVRTARPERKLEKPEALETYGLAVPRMKVTFSAKGAAQTLLIGSAHILNNTIFAKREDAAEVYVLAGTVFSSVAKSPNAFRDMSIVPSALDEPERIEILKDGRTAYVLAREETSAPADDDTSDLKDAAKSYQWKIVSPVSEKSDQGAVEEILRAVRNLRAEEVVDAHPERTKETGFLPPKVTLKALFKDSKEIVVDFGDSYGDPGFVRAIPPKGYLVTVKAELLAKLDVPLESLKDKSLAEFNVSDVLSIELRRESTSFTISRLSGEDFTAEGRKAVDSEKALDQIRRLVDLSGKRFLAGKELEKALGSLEHPTLAVRLLGAEDKVLADLKFAVLTAKDKKETVAVAAGKQTGTALEINPDVLDGWPKDLSEWLADPNLAKKADP